MHTGLSILATEVLDEQPHTVARRRIARDQRGDAGREDCAPLRVDRQLYGGSGRRGAEHAENTGWHPVAEQHDREVQPELRGIVAEALGLEALRVDSLGPGRVSG
jgi:hypothetical protein